MLTRNFHSLFYQVETADIPTAAATQDSDLSTTNTSALSGPSSLPEPIPQVCHAVAY